jgi:SEC-C motif-containing protein
MKQPNLCPCCSGLHYEACCAPYHQGKKAENALLLMRSRYSAYALDQPEYIMLTTHPKSPLYLKDKTIWSKQIRHFTMNTQFLQLKILDSKVGELESYVTFMAYLKQGGLDASFKETSRFLKENDQWLYLMGC